MKTIHFCISFFLFSQFLFSTIINVPADQPTIQAGINVSVNSDTVLVQPGTYVENINFSGKLITVGSLYLTTADTTIIGEPFNIDGYVINYNELPDTEHFLFLSFTTGTTHTHEFVAQYSSQMFYQVIAMEDLRRGEIQYLENLNDTKSEVG